MGCNSSKNRQVAPAGSGKWADAQTTPVKSKRPLSKTKSKNTNVDIFNDSDFEEDVDEKKLKKKKKKGLNQSLNSLNSDGERPDSKSSERGNSATSKFSKHSTDSGFDDEAYANVITEDSDPNKVSKIEQDFGNEREDLDLGLTGTRCSQRLSAKDQERLQEQRILASLREEGLISRPKSRAAGGLAYEIIADGPDPSALVARRPVRLAKLEKRKQKKELTAEEIAAKLERAEIRRKQKEQERLEKISATTRKSDVITALDSFEQSQKQKGSEITEKIDTVSDNREKRLQELRDKLKAKNEHAEKVRQRKKLTVLTPHPDSEMATRNDTPIA